MAASAARRPVVAVVGPTASGKTAVGISLAERFDGEIVSLDSRQMVRGLDIGTAKPTPAERARAVHHLIDVVDPDDAMSLADAQALAYAAIDGIHGRRRLPVLVGGTGQYVRAVLGGWIIPRVPPDPRLRAALADDARRLGSQELHARLAQVDPVAASRIDPRNVRRVVRALEVHAHTGGRISDLQDRASPPYATFVIGLAWPREALYARVDDRIDEMLAAGLECEVQRLLDAGYGFELSAMSGVGYAQWRDYFAGRIDREEVRRRIRRDSRRLVRQQATWFRADDPGIRWFDMTREDAVAIQDAVQAFLAGGS